MEPRTYFKIIVACAFGLFLIPSAQIHAQTVPTVASTSVSQIFSVTPNGVLNVIMSKDRGDNPYIDVWYGGKFPGGGWHSSYMSNPLTHNGNLYTYDLNTALSCSTPSYGGCENGTYIRFSAGYLNNDYEMIYNLFKSATTSLWSTDFDNSVKLPTFSIASGNYSTRFLNATVTASTTNPKDFHIDLSYYLNPNEINKNVSSLNPTQVTLSWAIAPSTAYSKLGYDLPSGTGTSTYRIDVADNNWPDNGTINALVTFSNGGCFLGLSDCPFPKSYLYLTFTMNNKAVTGTTTVENYNTISTTVKYEECSLTNFSACINNSLIFLFVPSGDVFTQFLDIRKLLDTIKPFGYFTLALTALNGVNNSTSPAYTLASIPFQTAIFDPLKNASSAILWAVFIFIFYEKRVKKIII